MKWHDILIKNLMLYDVLMSKLTEAHNLLSKRACNLFHLKSTVNFVLDICLPHYWVLNLWSLDQMANVFMLGNSGILNVQYIL